MMIKATDNKGREIANLYLNTESGFYYWREKVAGRAYFETTRQKTLGKALTAMKLLRAKALGDDSFGARSRTFSVLFKEVVESKKNLAKKTYLMAMNQCRHLEPWFTQVCPHVKKFVKDYETYWEMYIQAQKEINPKRKLDHDRRYLLMALSRAREKGWIDKIFTKKSFKLSKSAEGKGRALNDDEAKSLLEAILEYQDDRLYVQALMALTMGMRKGEILQLELREITRSELNLDPKKIKTRSKRKMNIPISGRVKELLEPFIKECKKNKGRYIFPLKTLHGFDWSGHQYDLSRHWDAARIDSGFRKTVIEDGEEVEVYTVRFHDLRHTCATNLVSKRVPVPTISKILGMSEKVLNEIYDHVNEKAKEEFRNIFEDKF